MSLSTPSVRVLSGRYGWTEIEHNGKLGLICFSRGKERVSVYYNTGTVGTCEDIGRQGTTQLFRKAVTMQGLESIFQDVRVNKVPGGYYRRAGVVGQAEPKLVSTKWFGSVDDQLLREVVPGKTVMVALGDGWFSMDNDGVFKSNGNIPPEFTNKLIERYHQPQLAGVDIVALSGSDDRYFIQFANGEKTWNMAKTSKDFNDTMFEHSTSPVRTLAFSPVNGNGYYVKFENKHYKWANVPKSLDDYLNEHQLNAIKYNLPGVDEVNIGPGEEWFVRFEDGSWWIQGHPSSCDDRISQIQKDGGHIRSVSFGSNGTWLVLYFEQTPRG